MKIEWRSCRDHSQTVADTKIFFFAENVERTTICQLELDEPKVKQFKDAIENGYWFEFFMGMFYIVFLFKDLYDIKN